MTPLKRIDVPRKTLEDFILVAASLGVSAKDAEAHFHATSEDIGFVNDTYLVIYRKAPADTNLQHIPNAKHLSIRRLDGQPIRNWCDLQQIKNELLGENGEAVEVFPAEHSKVNSANQYHLFGAPDWQAPFRFPR